MCFQVKKEKLKRMKICFQHDVIKEMFVRLRESLISIGDNIELPRWTDPSSRISH